MRSRSAIRLRPSTPPVLPPTPTVPLFRTSKASMALLNEVPELVREEAQALGLRGPRRDRSRWRANSVTACAMASSRHRLSVLNSSAEIGISSSMASSVTAWHTSP